MYQTNHLYQAIHEKNERDGEQGEKQALPILNKYFDADFMKSKDKYSVWDFIDTKKKIVIELKTRKDVGVRQYPKILIGYSKYSGMESFMERGYKGVFVWILKEGMYMWEVPKELPDNIDIENQPPLKRGDRPKPCLFIPNNLLIKMKIL